MKVRLGRPSPASQHRTSVAAARAGGATPFVGSPRQVGQRQRLGATFGSTVQAKFAGALGPDLDKLTPAALGVEHTYYQTLWTALKNSASVVKVEPGPLGYVQESATLLLHQGMLTGLQDLKNVEPKLKATWVALMTHELSHAHDHLIQNRFVRTPALAGGVEAHTKEVIDTELRAWAREALTAYQISPTDLDDEKRKLCKGWQAIKPEMLDDLAGHAGSNEVVARLLRYAERELAKKVNTNDLDVTAQEWATNHAVWLKEQVVRLRDALSKKW